MDPSPITNVDIHRYLSAMRRHRAARHNACSIHMSRTRKSRWDDPTGDTAKSIDLFRAKLGQSSFRDARVSPSITTIGSMDSGSAPRGASSDVQLHIGE